MSPRDLVCARCWRDFFDSEIFEKCCIGNDNLSNSTKHETAEIVTTTEEIRNAQCNWCAYIRSFIQDSWHADDKITVRLSPSIIDSCTPKGRNIFYLSIDCHDSTGDWIGGSSLFIHAWTRPEDDSAEYVTARPLRTDVGSGTAKAQLRTWSKECSEHRCCVASYQDAALPTRVIEVNPPGRRNPRLLGSKDLHGVYATLSYCWGETPFSTLTRFNYDELIEELNPLNLPPTFSDAIFTARSLSIPYLWIDALCIVQDSEVDVQREMSCMKDIYASSALTIVAASARSVSEGFLRQRSHSELSHTIPFRIQPGVFGAISINELDAASYDERLEPLAKRAWTVQEQLLSQRTLTFTSRTMMWKCPVNTRNYGDSLYFPHDLDMGYNDNDDKYSLNLGSLLPHEDEACGQKDQVLSCWMRLVTAYSLRIATLERDKLNAVAGIASHPSYSCSLGPGYFAGLWPYNLPRQLTWSTASWHRAMSESGKTVHRPTTYRAPSWSWASIEGGIIHFDFSYDEDETMPEIVCDIVDCSTVAMYPDLNPFGEVLSGTLTLRTAARRAWFNPSTCNLFLLPRSTSFQAGVFESTEQKITIDQAWKRHVDEFRSKYPDIDLNEEPEASHGTDHRNTCGQPDEIDFHDNILVVCVALTRDNEKSHGTTGLLLLPADSTRGNGFFKRIGRFSRARNDEFGAETEIDFSII